MRADGGERRIECFAARDGQGFVDAPRFDSAEPLGVGGAVALDDAVADDERGAVLGRMELGPEHHAIAAGAGDADFGAELRRGADGCRCPRAHRPDGDVEVAFRAFRGDLLEERHEADAVFREFGKAVDEVEVGCPAGDGLEEVRRIRLRDGVGARMREDQLERRVARQLSEQGRVAAVLVLVAGLEAREEPLVERPPEAADDLSRFVLLHPFEVGD